jgi:hypothetical protein
LKSPAATPEGWVPTVIVTGNANGELHAPQRCAFSTVTVAPSRFTSARSA